MIDYREVHERLKIKTPIHKWIKRMISRCDLIEGYDYVTEIEDVGKTVRTNYKLSENAVKEICLIQNTKEGKLYRRYLIECEKLLVQINPKLVNSLANTLNIIDGQKCTSKNLDTLLIECEQKTKELIEQLERTNKLENSYCLSDVCCKFQDCSPIDISHDLYMDNYTDYSVNGKFPTEYAPDSMISVTDKYGRAYVRFTELYWISEYIKSKGYKLK